MVDVANDLVLTRVLDAPRDRLWRCWVEPELLKQWFCPKPWYASEARIDSRPGGEFFTLMNGPDGEQFGEPGVVLEAVEKERLVFTDAPRPGWRPSGRAFMAAEVLFDDAGAGKTRYTARAMHWSAEARKEHEGMGFPRGLGQGRRSARSPRQDALIAREKSTEPTIYLFFNGKCLEAMTHSAEGLGGEVGGVSATPMCRMRKAACPAAAIS